MPTISQRLGYGVRVKNVDIPASVILPGEAGQTEIETPRQSHSDGAAHVNLVTSVDTA